jgi:hypothetical protein
MQIVKRSVICCYSQVLFKEIDDSLAVLGRAHSIYAPMLGLCDTP